MKTIITIGSGKESPSHIIMSGDFISNNHGELVLYDSGRITYEDYSLNGTTVNGKNINNTQQEVKRGDTIMFPGNLPLDWSKVPQIPQPSASTYATKHIGRDTVNDIRYEEKQISRTHAMVRVNKDCSVILYDKSVNGTTLNGAPVQRFKEIPVKHSKDKIVFAGRYELDWKQIPKPLCMPKKLMIGLGAVLLALGSFILTPIILDYFKPKEPIVLCSNEQEYEKHAVFIIKYDLAKVLIKNEVIYFGSDPRQNPSIYKTNLKPFTSTGTGFGVKKGYFATNHHVVASDQDASIKLTGDLLKMYPDAMKAIFDYAKLNGAELRYEDITYETQKIYIVKDGNKVYYNQFTKFEDLPPGQFFEVKMYSGDLKFDLAIVKLIDPNLWNQFSYITPECIGSNEDIKPNTKIRFFGYPSDKIHNRAEGYYDIGKYRSSGEINKIMDDGQQFMADYQNSGGASGAPIYDLETGKLIGINKAMLASPGQVSSNTAYAIKVDLLVNLIKQLPE